MSKFQMKTILVVEDEPAYQRALSEKFKYEGYDVFIAQNGEEGLAMALEKHPDIIITDLLMPKMDGIEMTKKLREDDWGKKAKMIVLTNVTDFSKMQEVMQNDIFVYLPKADTKIEEVVAKVREMTE